MAAPLNFGHLYYFWVVAKEGGIARAAERLGMAVQTVSAQVRALEQSLGHALFKPTGRTLALTEAGEAAMGYAEQIFQLGEELPAAVRDAATGQGLRLRVGISDGLPKLVVRHLLQPPSKTARRDCCATKMSSTACWPTWPCTGSMQCCRIARRHPTPTCACTATSWVKRRCRGSRRPP